MDFIALIGRILFVVIFVSSGISHLTKTDAMAAYAASKNVPSARAATQGSGVLILVASLMIVLGIWADLAALLLALFGLATAFLMHNFWTISDPQTKQIETIQFNKDISLAGAALLFFGLYAGVGEDLGLTITGPLF